MCHANSTPFGLVTRYVGLMVCERASSPKACGGSTPPCRSGAHIMSPLPEGPRAAVLSMRGAGRLAASSWWALSRLDLRKGNKSRPSLISFSRECASVKS